MLTHTDLLFPNTMKQGCEVGVGVGVGVARSRGNEQRVGVGVGLGVDQATSTPTSDRSLQFDPVRAGQT